MSGSIYPIPDLNKRSVLPELFIESPNLFGKVLEKVLEKFQVEEEVKLLHYVDDLLICGKESEVEETISKILNFLGNMG